MKKFVVRLEIDAEDEAEARTKLSRLDFAKGTEFDFKCEGWIYPDGRVLPCAPLPEGFNYLHIVPLKKGDEYVTIYFAISEQSVKQYGLPKFWIYDDSLVWDNNEWRPVR